MNRVFEERVTLYQTVLYLAYRLSEGGTYEKANMANSKRILNVCSSGAILIMGPCGCLNTMVTAVSHQSYLE